jgi:hypothetical protein
MKIIASIVLLVTLVMSQCNSNVEPAVVPVETTETVDTTATVVQPDSVDVAVPTDSTQTVE